MTTFTPVVLSILDGWGIGPENNTNAIWQANTPNWDQWLAAYPTSYLSASGADVGLPVGQMGNSEVGHLTLGSGTVLLQDLPRINQAIEDGSFSTNPTLLSFIEKLKASRGSCHLMGLISDGGVHSHIAHIEAYLTVLRSHNIPTILHIWLDGRDTPPQSATDFLLHLLSLLQDHPLVSIGTISGRYYAMDRDKRWPRIKKSYDAIVDGQAPTFMDALSFVQDCYKQEIYDEFIPPHIKEGYQGIAPQDGIAIANFRPDRVRQIIEAMVCTNFSHFPRPKGPLANPILGMRSYGTRGAENIPCLFPPIVPAHTLGTLIAKAGLTQLRLAETEKYAHVTYFFNGGQEAEAPGESRILIPSPQVDTYDQQPEMSAHEVTDALLAALQKKSYDFIVVNFANPDMVGHTGNLPATITAIETIDHCLGQIKDAVDKVGGTLLITADHGNAEVMAAADSGSLHTAHTLSKVPFMLLRHALRLKDHGTLADVAPTILDMLGLSIPAEMTGTSLII